MCGLEGETMWGVIGGEMEQQKNVMCGLDELKLRSKVGGAESELTGGVKPLWYHLEQPYLVGLLLVESDFHVW